MTEPERRTIATTRATCPFVGSAIVQGLLPVRNSLADPLASIEDIRALGNRNGGSLGLVLALFATGNHTARSAATGHPDPIPATLFSLDFPGSQGVHDGDSGILLGVAPHRPQAAFHAECFARLAEHADGGHLTRAGVGRFIAANVRRVGATVKPGDELAATQALADVVRTLPAAADPATTAAAEAAQHGAAQRLTRILGANPLLASSGEFGLLFALIADDAATVRLLDVRRMFEDKQLPPGWDAAPKSALRWVEHTAAIAAHASTHFFLD